MQAIARDGLDPTQVVDLIADDAADVDLSVELVDQDLQVLDVVAAEPAGSTITYTADQTVPIRYSLILADQVDYATARLRPVVTVTAGEVAIEVRAGVCLPSLPTTEAGNTPRRWEVSGYGLTIVLNRPHGRTVRLAAGSSYLQLVRDLCEAKGLVVTLSAEADAKVASRDRIWPIDAATTTLQIVNDLLAEAGYAPIWMDPDGRLRSEPARDPADRGSDWFFDARARRTTVGPFRRLTSNRLDVPNRLVAISSAATAWDPVTGDGVHVIPTSGTSDDLPERNAVITLDAVDQEELVAAAERKWAEMTRVVDTVTVEALPNPLHWHEDVVRIVDVELGLDRRCLVTGWTLPLDGQLMSLSAVGL